MWKFPEGKLSKAHRVRQDPGPTTGDQVGARLYEQGRIGVIDAGAQRGISNM